ncbi:protein kinase domain-containing protein [Bailinhaonella thermotolerans]|uniref:Protein kinase domain-containing protein n=1 Tax=Bailinhaonella thermotolerans TaxID=1070861 RepID=A0A3A4AV28_9ACTN|nr:protein kinase [Bailinhaonella thermotolerans]RJL32561.1 hypothetical protein D5H75_13655 [Bailinhaonella thermotolerans]
MDLAPLTAADPERLGAYWLAGRLGSGGQGVVYEAYDDAGDRFAVKVLHGDFAGDAGARDRFAREVLATRRVAAFCTASVVAVELDGPRPYVVSEYVSGPTLRDAVARDGPYSGGDLVRLATAIATALAAIHRADVIHRDLKPDNVLLGPDGPRVIDFGVARTGDMSLTTTGRVAGTPAYMAPEVFVGHRATPAADVFAWGGVVLYAATGRDPFEGDTLGAVMYRVLTDVPALDALPDPLRPLVAAALAKAPESRPSARDLLLTILDHTAHVPSPPAPPPSPPGSGRTAAAPARGAEDAGEGRAAPAMSGEDALAAPGEEPVAVAPPRAPADGATGGRGPAARPSGDADGDEADEALLERGARAAGGTFADAGADPGVGDVAERVFAGLAPGEREAAPEVFLRLVSSTADGEDARRAASPEELAGTRPEVWAVVERYRDAGLITDVGDRVSLAQPALLRAWPRMREWIEAERPGLPVYRRLAEDARGWRAGGRRPGDLYQGGALEAALRWAATGRRHLTLTPLEREFLDAGTAYARRRQRTRRAVTATLAVLLVVALAAVTFAETQRREADAQRRDAAGQRDRALARQIAAEADALRATRPETAMLLSVAAYRLAAIRDSRGAVLSSLVQRESASFQEPGATEGTAYGLGAKGRLLAAVSGGEARVWDVGTHKLVRRFPGVDPAPAYTGLSPDGTTLVAVNERGAARFWSVATGKPLGPPFGKDLGAALFGRGGRRVVFFDDDVGFDVREAPSGRRVMMIRDPAVSGDTSTLSPDERYLAAGAVDERIRVWDLERGGEPVRIPGHTAAFTPGGLLAVGETDGEVRLWDHRTREPGEKLLSASVGASLRFSEDGRFLVETTTEQVRLWAVSGDGAELLRHRPRETVWEAAALSPDNGTLRLLGDLGRVITLDVASITRASAFPTSAFNTVFDPRGRVLVRQEGGTQGERARFWDVRARRPLGPSFAFEPVQPATDMIHLPRFAFSPDGRVLAVGSSESARVTFWEVPSGRRVAEARVSGAAEGQGVNGLAYSRDGRRLAVSLHDEPAADDSVPPPRTTPLVRLWDTGERRWIDGLIPPAFDGLMQMAFSPDGRYLLADGKEGGGVVDLTTGRAPPRSPGPSQASGAARVFSPDGQLLVTAAGDVAFWDARTLRPVGLPVRSDATDVVFAPDGATFATSGGRSIRLWDTASRRQLGLTITLPDEVKAIAFDEDGTRLYSTGTDDVLREHVADPDAALPLVCARAGRDLTREEWRAHVPDLPYRPACPR